MVLWQVFKKTLLSIAGESTTLIFWGRNFIFHVHLGSQGLFSWNPTDLDFEGKPVKNRPKLQSQ